MWHVDYNCPAESSISARSMYLYLIDTAIANGFRALDDAESSGYFNAALCIASKVAQAANVLSNELTAAEKSELHVDINMSYIYDPSMWKITTGEG